MKEELDKRLCEKYPKIFADRYKDMTETAMCWGFSCGDGWYNIINALCGTIQSHIDWNNKNVEKGYAQYQPIDQVVVDQVKEKFGTLRFYYTGGDAYIRGLVSMAESMSAVTCEDCGNPGTQTRGGWIKTTCKPCEQKREEEYARQTAEYKTKKETNHDVNYTFIGEDSGAHD